MLFYILMFLAVAVIPAASAVGWQANRRDPFDMRATDAALGALLGLFASLIPGLVILTTWSEHASDISKVVAQEHRIEVQQERIESLTQRLDQFDYPEKPGISLDADTPWALIVESLTDAENELAKAKDERAIAIRSIEARKRGPMSGVVSFVGDYKQ